MRQSDLFLDSSILYRSTQKYYDKKLQKYNLTYAQLPILIMIYEHEGISMQEIATQGVYDKGTITKNVQKLESLGFVDVISSKRDKRAKELYTTEKAKDIMSSIYRIRQDWYRYLNENIEQEDIKMFSDLMQTITNKARVLADQSTELIQFYKHQKINMDVYPNHISTVFYTGGCNFQCPHCQKRELVFLQENQSFIPKESIEKFLDKRKNTIQSICIGGGEPCMHPEIVPFLEQCKALGYKTMIITNGSYPDMIELLCNNECVDRVVISLKGDCERYAQHIGFSSYDVDKINESMNYLFSQNKVEYAIHFEVYEDYDEQCIRNISKWLKGCKNFKLLNGNIDEETYKRYLDIIRIHIPKAKGEKDE